MIAQDEGSYVFETEAGRFAYNEGDGADVRIADPSLSREIVMEKLQEEANGIEHRRNLPPTQNTDVATSVSPRPLTEVKTVTDRQLRDPTQSRTRYWTVEESAESVESLLGIDEELADEVHSLAEGSIGVIKAIKERLADELSYDPGEALTPERIRSIVGAPSDLALLDSWRTDFYEPYRQKYRAPIQHPVTGERDASP